MLSGGVRLLIVGAGALLVVPLATAPAAAGPSTSGSSAIGDGNLVPDGDYVGSANPDADVDATAGPTVDDGCAQLAGIASAADVAAYQRVYGHENPVGIGAWRYQVCAQTSGTARRLAARFADPADAEAHCRVPANECMVMVVWQPLVRTPLRPERSPQRKMGAFHHWEDFTPTLATSPTDQDGLIARLPTWVWDRNTADIRGICLPIYGGVCGFAVRLSTKWKTEGRTFCRSPGREYRPGSDDPRSASSCGWTYARQGSYGITGCKTWLVIVWRLPWVVPIVFPLELCSTHRVGVQESQVLAGGRPGAVVVS